MVINRERILHDAYAQFIKNEELYDAVWATEGDETREEAYARNCAIVSGAVRLPTRLTDWLFRCRTPQNKLAVMTPTR